MVTGFTKKEIKQFKKAYKKAVENEDLLFTFKGREVLVTFAKYVLEYVENKP